MKMQTSIQKCGNDFASKPEKPPRFTEKELLKNMTPYGAHADEIAVLNDKENLDPKI